MRTNFPDQPAAYGRRSTNTGIHAPSQQPTGVRRPPANHPRPPRGQHPCLPFGEAEPNNQPPHITHPLPPQTPSARAQPPPTTPNPAKIHRKQPPPKQSPRTNHAHKLRPAPTRRPHTTAAASYAAETNPYTTSSQPAPKNGIRHRFRPSVLATRGFGSACLCGRLCSRSTR